MGKWSRHPLGSDRALDIQDIFFNILMQNEDPDSYYLDLGREEIRNRLLSLKVDEIKQHIALNEDLKNNRFVIPYSYLEFDVLSIDKDICTLLKDCLKYHAMFTYFLLIHASIDALRRIGKVETSLVLIDLALKKDFSPEQKELLKQEQELCSNTDTLTIIKVVEEVDL